MQELEPDEIDELIEGQDSVQSLSEDQWRKLAFRIVALDEPDLLSTLLGRRLISVHILDDLHGYNILQAAVHFNSEYTVEMIMHREVDDSVFRYDDVRLMLMKGPVSALEMAIQREDRLEISDLIMQGMSEFYSCEELKDMLVRVKELAATEIQLRDAIITLRQMQLKTLMIMPSFIPLEKLKETVAGYDWFPSDIDDLSNYEKRLIYMGFRQCVTDAKLDHVHWFLSDWKVSFIPPESMRQSKNTLGDCAALGNRILYLDDDERSSEHEFAGYNSEQFFHTGLSSRWDGKTENYLSSLANLFENVHHHNRFYKMIEPTELTPDRLAVLSIIMNQCNAQNYYFTYPHLDLIVKGDQFEILKWLVEHDYLDLKIPFGKSDDDARLTEDQADNDDDDVCPICWDEKRDPKELDCGHAFCRLCLYRYAGSLSETVLLEIQCPKCFRNSNFEKLNLLTSYSDILATRIDSHLLNFDVDRLKCTVGDALLALASGLGSIQCMDWLINVGNVNPETLFNKHQNLMHIAASQGEWRSIKWLLENGFCTLSLQVDDNLEMPPEVTCDNMKYGASLAMDCFFKSKATIPDWVEKALASSNPDIVQYAQEYQKELLFESLPKQIENGITLDNFRTLLLKVTESVSLWFDTKITDEILNAIIVHNRTDLTKFILGSPECRTSGCIIVYLNLKKFQDVFQKATERPTEMQSTLEYFENISKMRGEFYEARAKVQDLCIKNGTIEEIQFALRQEEKCFALIPEEHQHSVPRFRFDECLHHGYNALEYAIVYENHQLARWLLDNDEAFPSSNKHIKPLRSAILYMSFNGVKTVCEWMKLKQLSFNFSFRGHDQKDIGSTILDEILSLIPYSCGSLSGNSENRKTDCMKIFQYFVQTCNIDATSFNKPPLPELVNNYLISCTDESIYNSFSDTMAETVKILVDLGVDWRLKDEEGLCFIDKVMENGATGYYRAVEYLIRERGASIRYLVFKSFLTEDRFNQRDKEAYIALQKSLLE